MASFDWAKQGFLKSEMAEIAPDARIVRTYASDYAGTDSESEGEVRLEVDNEDEAEILIKDCDKIRIF